MTSAKSIYPTPVEELLPKAQELAMRLGECPSRNRLMSELRIGAKKANALLAAIESRASGEQQDAVRLQLVPESTETEEPEQETTVASLGSDERDPTDPGTEPADTPEPEAVADEPSPQEAGDANPAPISESTPTNGERVVRAWPVLLLALPAFVSIWSGWVDLGAKTGFGIVHPLPGIADGVALNTAITLPIGVETYAAYALRVWLSGTVPARARRFAQVSALGALGLGALGQIANHLMDAAGITVAPWWITTVVACLPVAVLGMGAALAHLLHETDTQDRPEVV